VQKSLPAELNDPQMSQRIQDLEDSRARLEEKSIALLNILEDLETERARAEENEHRFRALFENISDGIVVVNQNTEQISLVNAAACQLLGYLADELRGMKFADLKSLTEEQGQALQTQTGLETTCLIRKNGQFFPVEIRSSNLEIGGEKFTQHVFRDITGRIKAEQEMIAAHNFYLQVLQEAPALIWRSNAEGKCDWFNDSWLKFTGRTLNEEIESNWRQDIHPDDLVELNLHYQQGYQDYQTFESEYRLRRRDGEYRWIYEVVTPIKDLDGGFIGFLGYCLDITDRKTAEADLHKRTEEISLLYTAGRQLTSTLDLDSIFAEFYQIVSQMMDCVALYVSAYDPEDQIIRCLFAVQDDKEQDAGAFPPIQLAPDGRGTQSLVIRSGEAMILNDYLSQRNTTKNYYFVTKDGIAGTEIPEDAQVVRSALIVPMKLEGQITGTIQVFSYSLDAYSEDDLRFLEALAIQTAAVIHNASLYQRAQIEIDERRKAEQALRLSESQIRSSLAEKEVLIREIHHRVKNNLEVIISLADMQARLITDPSAVHSIRELQERVRTIALVHDDLYRSKNLANIHAETYLLKLTDNLFQVFGSTGIDLHVEAASLALDVEIAVPFGLIVTELVTNALKHAFPGRNELKLINPQERPNRIDLRLSEVGQQYLLEIRDNGIGLPPDFNWRTTRSLGLRLVNRLAEQLHGNLEMIDCEGTCFRLTFPGPSGETTGD